MRYRIEKSLDAAPCCIKWAGSVTHSSFPFEYMDVGDSFVFGQRETSQLNAAIRRYEQSSYAHSAHRIHFVVDKIERKLRCVRTE